MPAMIMIGAWSEFNFIITALISFTGGLLGILFMIPMRRIFVVNPDRELHFPEAVACAEVLNAGNNGSGKNGILPIVQGASAGFFYKVLSGFIPLFATSLEGATRIGSRIIYFGGDISPALVAVGVIVGLQVSLLIGIGGALGWLAGIPLLSEHAEGMNPLDGAWFLWSKQVRYVGVGCMAVGGIASIWRVRAGIALAVRELVRSSTGKGNNGDDLPGGVIGVLASAAVVLVFGIYYMTTGSAPVTLVTGCIMVVMAFFFTGVASYIVGLVGNSNSPVSGMTITTVLFTGLLLTLFGFTGSTGMTAVLCVAAVVCCAACTAGDVCNDLRTGYLVGASPRKQQIMQIAGVGVACLVMAPVLQLLHSNTPGGIGGKELPAPQAALFAGLAEGFFGNGTLRWDLVGSGAVVGLFLLGIDAILIKVKSPFRLHLMPVAVGIYLPFLLAVPIVAGGVIAYINRSRNGNETADGKVLFASGAIAGESLTGVGIALCAALGVSRIETGIQGNVQMGLTVIAALGVLSAFYHFSKENT